MLTNKYKASAMKKVPISIIIDDPAPIISVYESHAKTKYTKYGEPLIKTNDNDTLFTFIDIVKRYGIKGKFSVVPMPGNKGDIVNGLEGVSNSELNAWLDAVKSEVYPNFSITPELLTHNKAVDLSTMKPLDIKENDWSQTQSEETLTQYIEYALTLLKKAGFDVLGVSSPWDFGIKVEPKFHNAIINAVYNVFNKKQSFFFLRGMRNLPNAKPWVEIDGDKTLVSIPATTHDVIWETINSTEDSDEYISSLADKLISKDGKSGEIITVLETGGYPILITHWQSLISNGSNVGFKVLEEVCNRIEKRLSDKVEWYSFEEILNLVLNDKKSYPKPPKTDSD